MTGKHGIEAGRLAGCRSYRFHTDAEDIPLARQERHALGIETRGVRSVRPGVEEFLAGAVLRPIGPNEHPGMRGNATVLRLPLLDDRLGNQEVRVCRSVLRYINDTGRSDEA